MVRESMVEKRKIGVNFDNQLATILLWAPLATQIFLKVISTGDRILLKEEEFGYWTLTTNLLAKGDRYQFEVHTAKGVKNLPDPATLSQPDGIVSSSAAFDVKDYPWTDENWTPLDLKDYIIYELHVGTFTPEGTFYGIEQKLDYLIELGVTAIEIMPVSQFPGTRNWGYDVVFPFAVQSSYGGALALQKLVNCCHQKGLSVILDVVYNHFGPEGNNFADFAPYFTNKYHTPWGDAINFDDANCDGVRHFFIENVLMWFRDFHIDALRLDAVHAIKDLSPQHILAAIRENVDYLSNYTGKKYHLIIECDLNDNKLINPIEANGYGMDAQWVDEFHHALRVTAGQERNGYYMDFNGIEHLAKSYHDAYIYDGIFSEERQKTFGTKAAGNGGNQFVVFSQNHDQVGNRALGERSSSLYSFKMLKVLFGAVAIAPFIPLLFMGEEFGETNPFLYFVSHSNKDLIEAVRKGRSKEFEAFHLDKEVPDPQEEGTLYMSKLQWSLMEQTKHHQLFNYYKNLIDLRKHNCVLNNLERKNIKSYVFKEQNCLLIIRWQAGETLCCMLNFSQQAQEIKPPTDETSWNKLFDSNAEAYGGFMLAKQKINTTECLTIQAETFLIYSNHV